MPFYGPLDDEHDPKEVIVPANLEDPLEDNEPLRYRVIRDRLRETGFDGMPLKTEADWRRMICNYWGLVTQVDLSGDHALDVRYRLSHWPSLSPAVLPLPVGAGLLSKHCRFSAM